MNLYQYGMLNPMRFIDPLGLSYDDDFILDPSAPTMPGQTSKDIRDGAKVYDDKVTNWWSTTFWSHWARYGFVEGFKKWLEAKNAEHEPMPDINDYDTIEEWLQADMDYMERNPPLWVLGFCGGIKKVGGCPKPCSNPMTKEQLPHRNTKGKIRYRPPKNWKPTEPLPRGPQNGFMDRFGNEWTRGPSRTKGEPFEWDVQRPDGGHWNISLKGKATHEGN